MNWTDQQLKFVEQGKITLLEAREFVKVRMWHKYASTTDLYLQFRHKLKMVRWIQGEYENHLKKLVQNVMAKAK